MVAKNGDRPCGSPDRNITAGVLGTPAVFLFGEWL